MISTQQLPACHRHIKGGQAADTLYTLAKYAAPRHLENTDAHEFHSLLCAAHIITIEHPLPKKQDAVTCFQAISQYHCGHLCPMCPYSARNKNRLEAEESILLSYALKDFTSFQFLKKSGLTAGHFQALFLLNDAPSGKIVSTLPLFRLAYSYIDHAGNETLAFKDLPVMIANALDQNNRGKLLPQNVQNIRTYLERLQTQCRSVTNEKIEKPLSCVLHPETATEPPASQDSRKENVPENPSETDCSKQEEYAECICIDGLLGREADKPTGKKSHPQPKVPDSSKQMVFHTDVTVSRPTRQVEQPLAPAAPEEESLFYPAVFSLHEADETGYPFYVILDNAADLRQLEVFLQFNPLVGMELVTDGETGREMVLLCAANQFYYVPVDSEPVLSVFHLYFSKSSIRRQICMEPYKIYHFLQHNGIYCRNVYSLRTAYRVLSEAKGEKGLKKPSEMIKELVSKINTYDYSPYIFSMLQYVRMYEVLSAHTLLSQKEHAQRLRVLSSVEMFLGISYKLEEIADTQKPLFDLSEKLECQFHYTSDLKLKEGIYSVTFTFSHEKPVQSLVTDILYRISRRNLAHIYGYRLLRFAKDSFTIATTAEYYGQLCEIVANISTYLAERQDLIPLIVKEKTENSFT